MMIMGGEDHFITMIQQGDSGTVTFTSSDDLAVVIGKITAVLAPAGIEPRVFLDGDRLLSVVAR